jgi:hypothetical protein
MKDLIIVVPPGTRVRYIESPYTNDEILMMDASALFVTSFERSPLDSVVEVIAGLPVYNAKKYINAEKFPGE